MTEVTQEESMNPTLWLLSVAETTEADAVWSTWYDKNFGFVVRASSEEEARALAQAEARRYDTEGHSHGIEPDDAWLKPSLTSCTRLLEEGSVGIILRDYRGA